MRLYNTLTRREEEFTPAHGKTVRMYTCGLTVYARGHIGNFRTFVALDVLRRALEFEGYAVRQVRNYTDVDDRTIAESIKAGKPLREYTQQFVEAFETGRRRARARAGRISRRARPITSTAMAGMIQALEQNGHTYASDGSIYFKISTFPEYGQAGAARSRRHQERRARRLRQVRQGRRARLRALEGRRSRASRRGSRGCRRAAPAGTSSARRWPRSCSASCRSTSTAAAST